MGLSVVANINELFIALHAIPSAPPPLDPRSSTHLDDLVPASRDNDGVGGVGREAYAADPLGVAVLLDVELALAEGVPELDGAVTRARDDLTVVGAEADAQYVGSVADEAAGSGAGVEVPQTQSLVP